MATVSPILEKPAPRSSALRRRCAPPCRGDLPAARACGSPSSAAAFSPPCSRATSPPPPMTSSTASAGETAAARRRSRSTAPSISWSSTASPTASNRATPMSPATAATDCEGETTLFLLCDSCGAAGEASSAGIHRLIAEVTAGVGFVALGAGGRDPRPLCRAGDGAEVRGPSSRAPAIRSCLRERLLNRHSHDPWRITPTDSCSTRRVTDRRRRRRRRHRRRRRARRRPVDDQHRHRRCRGHRRPGRRARPRRVGAGPHHRRPRRGRRRGAEDPRAARPDGRRRAADRRLPLYRPHPPHRPSRPAPRRSPSTASIPAMSASARRRTASSRPSSRSPRDTASRCGSASTGARSTRRCSPA